MIKVIHAASMGINVSKKKGVLSAVSVKTDGDVKTRKKIKFT